MAEKSPLESGSIVESQLPSYLRSRNRGSSSSVSTSNSASSNQDFGLIAGESINLGVACNIHSDGKVYIANGTEARFICVSAVAINGTAQLRDKGILKINGSNFTPNLNIYLSSNGTLTQTVPTTNYSQKLGFAISTDTIIINIGTFYLFQ